MSSIDIRQATIKDASLILKFITELAIYEKAEHKVKATESEIQNTLFGSDSKTEAVICTINGTAVGYAVYFFTYSTWLGKHGLYLEDLYISSASRGSGAGKAMLKHLAKFAISKDCGRFEWSVLDWNEPAIKFYESLGAKRKDEWVGYRLTGKSLEALAND